MPIPEHMDYRLFAPWGGVVIDNKDPEGLHRVRIKIPGLIEQTRWTFPITSGGGSPGRGGHMAPALGADVVVWFLGGDVEQPRYQAAHWGVRKSSGKETPSTITDAGSSAHLISEWQVGPMLFTVDERPRAEDGSGRRFTIKDTNADKVVMEYDFELQGWTISSDYIISLETGGFLKLDGLQVQIAGRTAKRGTVRQF